MNVTEDYVRAMLRLQGIPVPEEEIANVTVRFALWIEAFDAIEAAIGDAMDREDPVPPVFPAEDF